MRATSPGIRSAPQESVVVDRSVRDESEEVGERTSSRVCCNCVLKYTEQSSLLNLIVKGSFALAMTALAGAPFCVGCVQVKTVPRYEIPLLIDYGAELNRCNSTIVSALSASSCVGDIHHWNAVQLLNWKKDFDMESHSLSQYFSSIPELSRDFIVLVSRCHMFYRSIKQDNSASNYAWNVVHLIIEYYDIQQSENVLDIILTPLNLVSLLPWDDMPFVNDPAEDDHLEAQSLSVEKVRRVVETWKKISECELATKADLLIQGIISCGITKILGLNFNRQGYELLFGRKLPSLRAPSLNMVMYRVVDFVVTVVETCHECFASGDLQPLIVRDRRVRDFLDKHQKLSDEIDTMSRNMHVNGFELIERAKELYAEGLYLQPTHPMVTPFVKDLAQKFQRVKSFFGVPAIRKPPFSILIHSPPGMGKTMIGNLIASVYAHTVNKYFNRGLVFNPQTCMHSFNPESKFMDGYKGTSTWWIHADDLAKEHVKHVASGISTGISRVIDLINPCGRASEQAAVEDKGTIPVDPALVTASTNVKHLNAFHAVETPSALLRRLGIVVTPKLKPEFIDETGYMKKLSHIEFDAHTFKIERVRINPKNTKYVEYDVYDPVTKEFYNPLLSTMQKDEFCNKQQFVEFLVKSIIIHEKNAEVMFEQSKMYTEVTYCDHYRSNIEGCDECLANGQMNCFGCKLEQMGEGECDDHGENYNNGREDTLDSHQHDWSQFPIDKKVAEDTFVQDYLSEIDKRGIDSMESRQPHIMGVPQCITMEHDEDSVSDDVSDQLETQGAAFSYCKQPPPKLSFFQQAQLFVFNGCFNYCPSFLRPRLVNYIFSMNPDALSDLIRVTLERRVPPKVREFLTVKNALIAAGGMTAVYLAFQVVNSCKMDDEPCEAFGNIWCKDLDEQDFFELPSTCHRNNDKEIINTVKKSTFRLGITPVDKGKEFGQEVNVIALGRSQYLTVNHAFYGDGPWKCVANYGQFVGNTQSVRPFILESSTVRRIPSSDLLIFTTASILPRKSLRKHILKKCDMSPRQCKSITLEPSGEVLVTNVFQRGVDKDHIISYSHPITKERISIIGNDGESYGAKSKRGDCGSVVVSKSSRGWFISGIRVAGAKAESLSKRTISSPISLSILEPYLDLDNDMAYLDSREGLDINKRVGDLLPPYRKGIHTFLEPRSNVMTLGSFGQRHTHTSQVKRTCIADDYEEEFGVVIDAVPPLMKPEQLDGEWFNPYTLATQVSCRQSSFYTDEEVLMASRSYLEDTTKDLSWLECVKTLDTLDAINGISGDDLLNCLPMNTSGGLTFPGKKCQYFERVDEIWYPKPELMKAVKKIEECYTLGERANIVFQGSLKDEPVSSKKRSIGKTRVFTACPVSFSIVVRKQFLTLTKAMRMQNYLTECAVGMNCYSTEWCDLYHYLTSFGKDKIVAGDYKSFDKEMAANVMRGAFNILIQWRKLAGSVSRKDMQIMEGIATDICQPIVNMNGDVFQFFGSNPSGQPLTAILNSLVNSIYMRIAFSDLGGSLCDFKRQVHLMTYGDDNILNTCLKWFNHTAIQQTLKKRNVTYTMAQKDAVSVPFIHISEADFLKRSFEELEGRIVAPLSISSIHKMIGVMVEKGNVSEEEVIAQSYLSARMEMCLHGKEKFDNFSRKMESILENHPHVKMLLTKQHYLSYDQTFKWVCDMEEHE